jgi:hypothetical protein
MESVPSDQRKAEGIKIVVEQIEELLEMRGISGIDIIDLDFRNWFPSLEIIDAAKLSDRPQV